MAEHSGRLIHVHLKEEGQISANNLSFDHQLDEVLLIQNHKFTDIIYRFGDHQYLKCSGNIYPDLMIPYNGLVTSVRTITNYVERLVAIGFSDGTAMLVRSASGADTIIWRDKLDDRIDLIFEGQYFTQRRISRKIYCSSGGKLFEYHIDGNCEKKLLRSDLLCVKSNSDVSLSWQKNQFIIQRHDQEIDVINGIINDPWIENVVDVSFWSFRRAIILLAIFSIDIDNRLEVRIYSINKEPILEGHRVLAEDCISLSDPEFRTNLICVTVSTTKPGVYLILRMSYWSESERITIGNVETSELDTSTLNIKQQLLLCGSLPTKFGGKR